MRASFTIVSQGSFFLRILPMAMIAGCGTLPAKRDVTPSDENKPALQRQQPSSESYVVNGKRYYTLKTSKGFVETGVASWYGSQFHGRRTSSGEIYDMYQMTAAHKHLPLPTYVKVTNLFNGRSAIMRINDRGPFIPGRVIDLSYAAALTLDIAAEGTGLVRIQALGFESNKSAKHSPVLLANATDAEKAAVFLQVGAFASLTNAERLRHKVTRILKHTVLVHKTLIANRLLYRVHIGPFPNAETADSIWPRLSHLGLRDYRLVSN
ncbi:MAG: septal ring lytic transglycosylase RlpA family protein [Gammaproteobacteria bacterium]